MIVIMTIVKTTMTTTMIMITIMIMIMRIMIIRYRIYCNYDDDDDDDDVGDGDDAMLDHGCSSSPPGVFGERAMRLVCSRIKKHRAATKAPPSCR